MNSEQDPLHHTRYVRKRTAEYLKNRPHPKTIIHTSMLDWLKIKLGLIKVVEEPKREFTNSPPIIYMVQNLSGPSKYESIPEVRGHAHIKEWNIWSFRLYWGKDMVFASCEAPELEIGQKITLFWGMEQMGVYEIIGKQNTDIYKMEGFQ